MNHRLWIVVATLFVATVPLGGTSAADATGCQVTTDAAAVSLNGYYMYGTAKEVWEESNGLEGLQRSSSFCTGRDAIPADTCVVHSETWAALNCAVTLAGSS